MNINMGQRFVWLSIQVLTCVLLTSLVSLLGQPAHGTSAQQAAESWNMQLVGRHDLHGRSAYQPVIQERDGRWIAYIGHHNGRARNPLTGAVQTNGTSIVDVTDPAHPVYLHHIPGDSGAQMVQTCQGAALPVGNRKTYLLRANGHVSHEVWEVTDPTTPTLVSTPLSGGSATHKNWWDCQTGIAYMVYDGRQLGWKTSRLLWVVDLGHPAQPQIIRQYGLVGQEPSSQIAEVPPGAHEATLSPDGSRLYVAYGTGNQGTMQIVNVPKLLSCRPQCPTRPRAEDILVAQVGRLDMPRFWGGHTAWPVIGIEVPEQAKFMRASPRDFVVLVSESLADACREDAHDMVFMVDITDETRPFPVANYQVPESAGHFCQRGGRFGAHSLNWSYNPAFYKKLIVVSYFNAGARAVDIRDPFRPVEVGFFIPATTEKTASRSGQQAIQTNNVEIDDRGYIYLADRAHTGLHIVRLTGAAAQIVAP
jgi:hypothetical protein